MEQEEETDTGLSPAAAAGEVEVEVVSYRKNSLEDVDVFRARVSRSGAACVIRCNLYKHVL